MQKIYEFLLTHKIALSETDIVEHTLLQLAGISEIPIECKTKVPNRNNTRVEIELTSHMQELEAKQFLVYLKTIDESAKANSGRQRSYVYECAMVAESSEVREFDKDSP